VLAASDASFGPKEALLRPGPVAFVPGTYDHNGEVVDGWETRRRRGPGEDWVVVRFGLPGVVTGVDVDTSSFTRNAPVSCRIEGCAVPGDPTAEELSGWQVLLPDTPLQADSHNHLPVDDSRRWTHLRLWVTPDGGVGRLRVWGIPVLDPRPLMGITPDLASCELGSRVVSCTDEHYSPASALLLPDRPRTMGEGWEASRRRGVGHDTVVVRLGLAGSPRLLELDTTCFVHNASAACDVWTANCPGDPQADDPRWQPLLPRVRLLPDTRNRFVVKGSEATHVRLDAHPDGGLARLRLVGPVSATAHADAVVRWLDALPDGHAAEEGVEGPGRPYGSAPELRATDPGLAAMLGL